MISTNAVMYISSDNKFYLRESVERAKDNLTLYECEADNLLELLEQTSLIKDKVDVVRVLLPESEGYLENYIGSQFPNTSFEFIPENIKRPLTEAVLFEDDMTSQGQQEVTNTPTDKAQNTDSKSGSDGSETGNEHKTAPRYVLFPCNPPCLGSKDNLDKFIQQYKEAYKEDPVFVNIVDKEHWAYCAPTFMSTLGDYKLFSIREGASTAAKAVGKFLLSKPFKFTVSVGKAIGSGVQNTASHIGNTLTGVPDTAKWAALSIGRDFQPTNKNTNTNTKKGKAKNTNTNTKKGKGKATEDSYNDYFDRLISRAYLHLQEEENGLNTKKAYENIQTWCETLVGEASTQIGNLIGSSNWDIGSSIGSDNAKITKNLTDNIYNFIVAGDENSAQALAKFINAKDPKTFIEAIQGLQPVQLTTTIANTDNISYRIKDLSMVLDGAIKSLKLSTDINSLVRAANSLVEELVTSFGTLKPELMNMITEMRKDNAKKSKALVNLYKESIKKKMPKNAGKVAKAIEAYKAAGIFDIMDLLVADIAITTGDSPNEWYTKKLQELLKQQNLESDEKAKSFQQKLQAAKNGVNSANVLYTGGADKDLAKDVGKDLRDSGFGMFVDGTDALLGTVGKAKKSAAKGIKGIKNKLSNQNYDDAKNGEQGWTNDQLAEMASGFSRLIATGLAHQFVGLTDYAHRAPKIQNLEADDKTDDKTTDSTGEAN